VISPAENAEIVRRLAEVWRDSGVAAMASEFLAPEVEYEDDPAWPDRRVAHSRDAVVQRFEDWIAAWGDEFDFTSERVQAVDDQVIAIFVVRTKGTTSGVPQSHRWGFLFELRDGLVVRFRAYLDPGEALRAAGLPE
jgi:ketosteroid isomerase-like protein